MTTEPLALADAAEGSDEDDIMGATHQLGVDPASIAYNNLRSMMKVVNDEVTVEWGKNGLIRQKIENTVKSLRLYGKAALEELKGLAAGRTEDDDVPPYMEMVDVDDLKAACAVYEKRVAVEAMKARRSDHEVNVLNYKLELAKQEIEELRKLKLVIAGLEVSNEELAEKLEVEKKERIEVCGREYRLEQQNDTYKKSVVELTDELRRLASSKSDPTSRYGAGAGMAQAYAEGQAAEMASLKKQVAKQSEELAEQEQIIEDRDIELQSLYYAFHKPRQDGYGVIT